MAHQIFSASSANRWIACPGSIAAASLCPPQPQNDFADEGTAAHLVAEYCLRFDCGPGDADVIVNGKPYEVDDEMREAVQLYLNEINSTPGKLFIEEEFLLTEDLGGTSDAAKFDPELKWLHVFDFKYGRRAVNALMNFQMSIYGKGLLKKFPEAEIIQMTIVQPRVCPSVSNWNVSVPEFEKWFGANVMEAYGKAKEPNAPRHAGTHCRYCPAFQSLACPESRKAITAATCSDFDITVPGLIATLPLLESLTNEQVSRLMDFSDLISDYAKAAKQAAHDRMVAGQKIPGWKLVQKRSNREWINEQVTIDKYGVIIGKKIFTAPELLSPAQMEKALKAEGKSSDVEAMTRKPDAGLTIAPESDKRKEVVPQIGSDFAGHAADDLV